MRWLTVTAAATGRPASEAAGAGEHFCPTARQEEKVRSSWQYYLIKFASRLVSLLPYPWLLALGRLLGRLYYLVGTRQRERALAQIKAGLGLDDAAAAKIIRSHFGKLGMNLLEVLYLPALTPDKFKTIVQLENRHYLDAAVAEGKGVAVLTAHVGNWEWLGAGLAMHGYPTASIVKPQPNELHTRLLNEYRRRAGIEIFTRGTAEVVAAVKALRQGRVLGFFIDQDAGPGGLFVEFFGKMASTPTGLAVFARKLGCPVLPAFILRRPEGGHRIVAGPPFHLVPGGDEQADIRDFTVRATNIVEETIRRHPDEWLWSHKRWNTKWAGEQA